MREVTGRRRNYNPYKHPEPHEDHPMPEPNPPEPEEEEITLEEWIAASQSCCGIDRAARPNPKPVPGVPGGRPVPGLESRDAPPQP